MTKNGNFKRRVRARAAKTGESYTAARLQVLGSHQSVPASENKQVRLAVAQMVIRNNPCDVSQFRKSGEEIMQFMRQALYHCGRAQDAHAGAHGRKAEHVRVLWDGLLAKGQSTAPSIETYR